MPPDSILSRPGLLAGHYIVCDTTSTMLLITSPPGGVQSILMNNEYICSSVCLFVCLSTYRVGQKTDCFFELITVRWLMGKGV